MWGVCQSVTAKVLNLLTTKENGTLLLNQIATREGGRGLLSPQSISVMNTAPELVERTARAKYPSIVIYCDKLTNSLTEKFRRVSGKAHITVEVRQSQDRLEHLETGLQTYVDAVCTVLDQSRGDWGDGIFYSGGYEATFGPVKAGGTGFLQISKVGFEVDVSR